MFLTFFHLSLCFKDLDGLNPCVERLTWWHFKSPLVFLQEIRAKELQAEVHQAKREKSYGSPTKNGSFEQEKGGKMVGKIAGLKF